MTRDALEIVGLAKAFDGREVLSEVHLAVPHRRVCALVGDNGSGKTTLINLCMGYIQPDRGHVLISGVDVHAQSAVTAQKVAYVPDQTRFYPRFSGIEHLELFENLRGTSGRRAEYLDTLLRLRFPIDSADRPVGSYSKGMRQKIAIALGLLKKAELFILDEPTSGLDRASVDELLLSMRQLADGGAGILFSTHHHDHVSRVADMVASVEDCAVTVRDGV